MKIKLILIYTLSFSILLVSCAKRIDSSNMETYQKTMKELQSELSEPEKDSLSNCIAAIISKSSHGILELDKVMLDFDGMSSADILSRGGGIIQRENFILDSTRAVFVADSIRKYNEQGIWEIKYFVDDFQEETKEGYVLNMGYGSFSNSATTNSKCAMKLLVTNDYSVQLFLYEYGNKPVKSSGNSGEFYSMKILKGGDKFSGEGFLYSDRLSFPDESLENLLSTIREGGKAKIYFKERSKYGTPSNYLAEFDFTNFEKAMSKLKSKK